MTVITYANFKGGVGKTSNCVMTGYALADMGYKVLIIDKDPQANATTLLYRTGVNRRIELVEANVEHGVVSDKEVIREQIEDEFVLDKFLMDGIESGSLKDLPVNVCENLDMIPTTPKFQYYPVVLEKMFRGATEAKNFERISYFSKLVNDLKDDYDYILIDVPPTISSFTDAALYATDYVVVVLQTHERSLQGAEIFIEYLNEVIVDKYEHEIDVAGILPVLHKTDSKIDQATLINSINEFGEENIFKTHIKQMERLKRYDITGITNVDYHDKKMLNVYKEVANELLERLNSLEG